MQNPPEQPIFPQTNANVTPEGVVLNIMLAANLQITTVLHNDMIDDIYAKSKEVRKEARRNLEIVKDMNVVRSINSKRGG